MRVGDHDQEILKKALRCLRKMETSKGDDVREINDLLERIQIEIKKANQTDGSDPKAEYLEKITGRTKE